MRLICFLLGHFAGKVCGGVGIIPADVLFENSSQELSPYPKDLLSKLG